MEALLPLGAYSKIKALKVSNSKWQSELLLSLLSTSIRHGVRQTQWTALTNRSEGWWQTLHTSWLLTQIPNQFQSGQNPLREKKIWGERILPIPKGHTSSYRSQMSYTRCKLQKKAPKLADRLNLLIGLKPQRLQSTINLQRQRDKPETGSLITWQQLKALWNGINPLVWRT